MGSLKRRLDKHGRIILNDKFGNVDWIRMAEIGFSGVFSLV